MEPIERVFETKRYEESGVRKGTRSIPAHEAGLSISEAKKENCSSW